MYVSNCQISSPIDIGIRADVDLGGFQFSYTHGLVFPPASQVEAPMRAPEPGDF